MRYTTEVELLLDVEVLDATRGRSGTLWTPPEPTEVELCVWLGDLDVTGALPADVLEALRAEALERLEEAAAAP